MRLDKQALPLMVERFAWLAEPADRTLPRPLPPPKLAVDISSRAAALERLKLSTTQPVAVLCHGAEYGPAKRWPVEYFAELGRKLNAEGFTVWLAGSGNDSAAGDEIARLSDNVCINLAGKTTLAEAIARVLAPVAVPFTVDRTKRPFVVLVAGVNGTGKTTTVGKLAARLAREPAWRAAMKGKMSANKHRVYRDRTSIDALEAFLERAVAERASS